MRKSYLILPALVLGLPAQAQISLSVNLPHVSIGVNVPTYPELVPVPGCPVYYAPSLNANYFFYDGRYWVMHEDEWYSSRWYNGPWDRIAPDGVPAFVLRVPVSYYRVPPPWFRGWRREEPPHWGDRWGRGWADNHRGWDHWDRRAVPPPAPLPHYQREFTGNRYPHPEKQEAIHQEHYAYQSREHYQPDRNFRKEEHHEDRRGNPHEDHRDEHHH